jgi:hypothetical protein
VSNTSTVGLQFVSEGFSEWLSNLNTITETSATVTSSVTTAAEALNTLSEATPPDASALDTMAGGAQNLSTDANNAADSVGKIGESAKNSEGGFSSLQEIATGALREIGAKALEFGLSLGKDALGAVADFVGGSVEEASQWNSVFAQTQAVIESTGGAAGVTAQEMATLAGNLSATSGMSIFSDDAILGAQNVLATFTNIKEDVFADATLAITNMSQAMGTDLNSSAMQVGKALNDPIAGLAALSRSGVQFTADQEAMIKGMVEAGDIMGAQKIMLGELETQFGGSAAAAVNTFAGQQAVLQEKFNDVKQTMGEAIMPLLMQLMIAIQPLIPVFADLVGQVAGFISSVDPAPIAGFVQALVGSGPAIQSALASVAAFFAPIFEQLMTAWGLLQPVLIQIGTALVEGFYSPGVQSALIGLRDLATAAIELVIVAAQRLYDLFIIIWPYVSEVVSVFQQIFTAAMAYITGVITAFTQLLNGDFAGAFDTVKTAWETMTSTIKSIVTTAFDKVKSYLEGLVDDFKTIGSNIIAGIVKGITDGAGKLKDAAVDAVKGAYESAKDWLGIESPSKLMRQKIGRQMSSGVALGISDGIPGIQRSMVAASATAYEAASVSTTNNYGNTSNTYNLGITTTASPTLIAQSFDIDRSTV